MATQSGLDTEFWQEPRLQDEPDSDEKQNCQNVHVLQSIYWILADSVGQQLQTVRYGWARPSLISSFQDRLQPTWAHSRKRLRLGRGGGLRAAVGRSKGSTGELRPGDRSHACPSSFQRPWTRSFLPDLKRTSILFPGWTWRTNPIPRLLWSTTSSLLNRSVIE